MRNTIVLVLLVAMFANSCASSTVTRSSGLCSPIPELVGSWKSYRTSSLGPAWMSITFNCDCTARVVSQLLFMRYSEVTPYRIENGQIVFTRERAETRWPFSLESGSLVLREAPDESHRYTRVGAASGCSAPVSSVAPRNHSTAESTPIACASPCGWARRSRLMR